MIDQRLLDRRVGSSVLQVSGFVQAAVDLDTEEFAEEYRSLNRTAPRRHAAGLKYFVEHTSVAGRTSSNRAEEHLAADLFTRAPLRTPRGSIQLVDFQFPLKAYRSDKRIGKVDLLGLLDSLVIVELKVLRPDGGADTPLGAALEAVAYAAIVEANQEDIAEEMKDRGLPSPNGTPDVLVLGTTDYWARWDQTSACEGWRSALATFAAGVGDSIGVELWFGRLDSEPTEIDTAFG